MSQTAPVIITRAMHNAGLLESTATASTDQVTAYLPRLNDLVNLWQTQGAKIWLSREVTVPLVAGKAGYTVGTGLDVNVIRPLRVDGAYYLSTTGQRRDLGHLSRQEYRSMSRQNGSVNSFYDERQPDRLILWLWNAPTTAEAAAGSVVIDVRSQVGNFGAVAASTAFPDEWALALQWGLADEISTGQPQAIMDRCRERATAYRTTLDDFEVEGADVRIEMDMSRSGYGTGSFR